MFAAKTAAEGRDRMVLLGAAAYWRNKAFDLQMERFQHLRELADGEGLPGRGEEDTSDEDIDTDPR